jgi:hypothetical protein
MVEGLGRSLTQEIVDGNLKGLCILNQLDLLSHLQFVDHIIMMGHPSTSESSTLKSIQDTFLLVSGTIIN